MLRQWSGDAGADARGHGGACGIASLCRVLRVFFHTTERKWERGMEGLERENQFWTEAVRPLSCPPCLEITRFFLFLQLGFMSMNYCHFKLGKLPDNAAFQRPQVATKYFTAAYKTNLKKRRKI